MVVEVDGQVRGFAFSGSLTRTLGCNFVRITDLSFRGLSYLLCHRLMAEFPDLTHFNDRRIPAGPGCVRQNKCSGRWRCMGSTAPERDEGLPTTLIFLDPGECAEVLMRMILQRAPDQFGHLLQSAIALGHGWVLLLSHDDYATANSI